ncbi:egl nine homolog 1 isoform X2 [Bombyx mandarina]|uniref:hypoxia-inducible factor-proline dioxygenase n=2 Tax=Bombyx TaxID=7090 RepID=A0A8R1WJ06_BOMMO|nr:egl nine homolog 1 [Bombyx mori]XP_028034758.1 egl nine homolog 1 isoform X1 [Bombyx mandarina]XP_028034760.1 egl nine homolog 1 isoform X2 [Bombyx mandarina]
MNQEGGLACCAVCNQKTQRRCARCLNIYYCNTEHQRQDWKRHKSECIPKLTKQLAKSDNFGECSTVTKEAAKEIGNIAQNYQHDVTKVCNDGDVRHLKKSKTKNEKKSVSEGSSVSKQNKFDFKKNIQQTQNNKTTSSGQSDSSVISSVVFTKEDLNSESAITYEGSSEKEILNESVQQLSTVDFSTATGSNVLRTINSTDTNMPILPEPTARVKEYPEASLKGSVAPFNHMLNSYYMDPSDPFYEICQRVIRDMTQYGVCVLNNFLGKDQGLLVLNEVLKMYRSGIFTAGQLVSSPGSTEAQTIRSDRITWIDGKEPQCFHIRQLISKVDNIILRANKMANNGKMGDFVINGRTKAMVACYPGLGSHYVKHVDNPNKDGRCITAIYYLNLDWDVKRYGGLLRVFPEGTNQVADIAPIFDRMLFFWSDRRNPHEVQPAYSTRYAITLWYFDAHEREEALRKYKERGQPSSSK